MLLFGIACTGQKMNTPALPSDTEEAIDSAGDSDPPMPPPEITLLTLNLHCFKLEGSAYSSNDARFAAIAALVAAEGVEALAVQEACENASEGVAMTRLASALQAATGDPWQSTWTPTHLAWTGTMDEAQEGVGLLSRNTEITDVLVEDYAVQGAQFRRSLSGIIQSQSGLSLRLYTLHLEYGDTYSRQAQARQSGMHALVHGANAAVLAGDYNATANDAPLQDLEQAGFTRLSADTDPNHTEIDHLLAPMTAGFAVQMSGLVFDRPEEAVSDHPGVMVRLQQGSPPEIPATHFIATGDIGENYLSLRGDTAPLSWDLGWPATQTASNRWEAVFLGGSGTWAYKWLLNDTTWETGDNHTLNAGSTMEVSPAF